jgi:tetratricopeptide (TPR) repeat protein
MGKAYTNLSTCYGMMHQLDSGIYFSKKGLGLIAVNMDYILTLKNLAVLYNLKKDYPSADSVFKKTLLMAETLKANNNIKAMVLGEYANMYSAQYDYKNSLKLLTKATNLKLSPIKRDSITSSSLRLKMAIIYLNMKNYREAEKEFITGSQLLKQLHQDTKLANAYLGLGEIYQNNKDYAKSDSILTEALLIFDRIKNPEYQASAQMSMAMNKLLSRNAAAGLPLIQESYQKLRDANSIYLTDAAVVYLKLLYATNKMGEGIALMRDSALQEDLKHNFSPPALDLYKAYLPFLESTGKQQEVNLLLKKIIEAADSVNNGTKIKEILELQANYQLGLKEQDEALLIEKNKLLVKENSLKTTQLIICLFVGAMVFLMVLYRISQTKLKVEKKTNELRRKTQQYINLQEKALALEEKIKEKDEKNLIAEKDEILATLNGLKQGSEYLDFFLVKFNVLHPGFSNLLLQKYPQLTHSDILFCSLIKMNLNTKEIASILNIEPLSVYRRKYRITEKMKCTDVDQMTDIIFSIA